MHLVLTELFKNVCDTRFLGFILKKKGFADFNWPDQELRGASGF